MPFLSLNAMEKILKACGAKRVGEDAKKYLREVLEEYAIQIGRKAIEFAKHAGRATVRASDIKLAVRT